VSKLLRPIHRGPVEGWPDGLAEFRNETVKLVRRRWWLLTIATVAGNLAVFAIFIISLRAVGIGASEVTWIEAVAGWSLARILQLIPLTPGGLVRLRITNGRVAREERYLAEVRERIRDVREGPDGAVYLLTDDSNGRLLRVTPAGR
jgi:hypothetical protein